MTITVEDGTVKANAESFCSVAYADSYFSLRSIAAWTGTDAAKEAALRASTDYMEQMYRMRWAGARTTMTQALSWPRYGVPIHDAPGGKEGFPAYVASNVVPDAVQRACAELALRALTKPLSPDVGRLKQRVKVGVIETDYLQGAPAVTTYRVVDNLLIPYLGNGSSMNICLSRS